MLPLRKTGLQRSEVRSPLFWIIWWNIKLEISESPVTNCVRDYISTLFPDFLKFIEAKTGYLANETKYFEPVIDGLYCAKYDQLPIPRWAEEKWSSMNFAMKLLSYEYWITEIPYYGNYIGKFVSLIQIIVSQYSISPRLEWVWRTTVRQKLPSAAFLEFNLRSWPHAYLLSPMDPINIGFRSCPIMTQAFKPSWKP